MKLLTKTNIYFAVSSAVTLIAGCVVFFFAIKSIIHGEIDDKLTHEKKIVLDGINQHDTLLNLSDPLGDKIEIMPVSQNEKIAVSFKDTVLFDSTENENIPYRSITFPAKIKNNDYAVTVTESLIESDDLFEAIALSAFIIIVLMTLTTVIINRWSSRKVWMPFYKTLGALKNYKLDENKTLTLEQSKISEFQELNRDVRNMTDRILKDYFNLKEFTENASHELQTPIAVIESKLELLSGQDNLNKEQLSLISSAEIALMKLSRLSKSLLLMSKIENNQFKDAVEINLTGLVSEKLEFYKELLDSKNIRVNFKHGDTVRIKMNNVLADSLFTNLLSNAIKYNSPQGEILITLQPGRFEIRNCARNGSLDTKKIFTRFYKEDNPDSIGLGLAIAKKISDYYSFDIGYKFDKPNHTFILTF